jgi:hypothetical protein
MIPVTQTKMVVRNQAGEMVVRGNCWAAAIASMLELTITEVPNAEIFFDAPEEFAHFSDTVMNTFLAIRGLRYAYDHRFMVFHPKAMDTETHGEMDIEALKIELKDRYYFGSGPSPRGVNHVCIYLNGQMVHDPHPSRDGLLEEKYFYELVKITLCP